MTDLQNRERLMRDLRGKRDYCGPMAVYHPQTLTVKIQSREREREALEAALDEIMPKLAD